MSAPSHNTPAPITEERKAFQNLNSLLMQSKEQIARALPRHLTPERLIRMAVTAFQRTPGLQKCSPISIVGCVIQAGELGLDLSGPLGQAYMVPYFNKHTRQQEAQFQIGYRGLVKLAFNSGKVSHFNAHEVCERDQFFFEYGTNQRLSHRPALTDRGDVIGYYSVLKMKDGSADFEFMSVEDINKHRDRYSKSADRQDSPWQTAFDEMAKKTVIRRLAKRAPVSAEMQAAAALDELGENGVPQGLGVGLEAPALPPPSPPVGNHSLRAPYKIPDEPRAGEAVTEMPEQLPDDEPEPVPVPQPTVEAEQEKPKPALSGDDQMALTDWIADTTDRIAKATRSIQLNTIAAEIQATTWTPAHVRQELVAACDKRNGELAPKAAKSRGQF
jgi:recombination protein RecT